MSVAVAYRSKRVARKPRPALPREGAHALLLEMAARLEEILEEDAPISFAKSAARQLRVIAEASSHRGVVPRVLRPPGRLPAGAKGSIYAWASRVDDAGLKRTT